MEKPASYGNIEDTTALFKQIALGDKVAFTHAFYHYNSFIYPFVLKKIRREDIAKEIVQEAFLKLWKYREAIGDTSSPERYFYRIVANLVQDYFRKIAYEQRVIRQAGEKSDRMELNQTEADINFSEAHAIYEKAVRQLSPQRRQVYDLREEGFSYEEIAEKLGISVHTVRNSLVKAVKTVKEIAQKKGLDFLSWLFQLAY